MFLHKKVAVNPINKICSVKLWYWRYDWLHKFLISQSELSGIFVIGLDSRHCDLINAQNSNITKLAKVDKNEHVYHHLLVLLQG